MKRRAMDMTMASSWTGTWSFFRGFSIRSRASVRAMGLVV
mgnify:CR=1 FL=1